MTVMALRDASWFNHPDVYSPKVYHSVVSPPYAAACNGTRMVLVANTEQRVDQVPVSLRCQRRACRKLWEADEAAPDPSSGDSDHTEYGKAT